MIGCDTGGDSTRGDAAVDGGAPIDAGSCFDRDSDGDGIPDRLEGEADPDGDGAPSSSDLDSDGDGLLDMVERGDRNACQVADSDLDGIPDFHDVDSDNDGLSDAREVGVGTDPREIDTDGDGVTDLGEVDGTSTDPLDEHSTIPSDDFFVVLPYREPAVERTLTFGTAVQRADIVFLVDTTSSTRDVRRQLIETITTLVVPEVAALVPDAQFGVAGFDDYPYGSHGGGNDLPFYLLRPVAPADEDLGQWSLPASSTSCPTASGGSDIGRIVGSPDGRFDLVQALEGLGCHSGADTAEAQVPALWALLTGAALPWPTGTVPAASCPDDRWGHACFRRGALPVVVLSTNAFFHQNVPGTDPTPYTDIPAAPSYADAVHAIGEAHARVVGLWGYFTASPWRADLERLVRDSGAVRADGTPLLFQVGSGPGYDDATGAGEAVVAALTDLTRGTPSDVTTRVDDVPGNPDSFDARQFVRSVAPLEGRRGAVSGAVPGTTYRALDETTFYDVIPGTEIDFRVGFENTTREPGAVAEIFRARIVVLGNHVAELDVREVYIVVPAPNQIVLI
jgi:hypothetical protein